MSAAPFWSIAMCIDLKMEMRELVIEQLQKLPPQKLKRLLRDGPKSKLDAHMELMFWEHEERARNKEGPSNGFSSLATVVRKERADTLVRTVERRAMAATG
jgi:hypothetical protein